MFNRKPREDKNERGEKGFKKKPSYKNVQRARWCRYCVDKHLKIDYKDGKFLTPFVTERGKIVPRRNTGLCAKHQREVTLAVKRARLLAIIPFTATQLR